MYMLNSGAAAMVEHEMRREPVHGACLVSFETVTEQSNQRLPEQRRVVGDLNLP
jgi:hypothetical protein